MPFRLWLLKTTYRQLIMIQRRHFGAAKRDLRREIPLPDRSSMALARQLLGSRPTPSQQAIQKELAAHVRRAVASLPETDRDVLLMRTFEGASFREIAFVLDIQPDAVKKRHGRALLRLHKTLLESGIKESDT